MIKIQKISDSINKATVFYFIEIGKTGPNGDDSAQMEKMLNNTMNSTHTARLFTLKCDFSIDKRY